MIEKKSRSFTRLKVERSQVGIILAVFSETKNTNLLNHPPRVIEIGNGRKGVTRKKIKRQLKRQQNRKPERENTMNENENQRTKQLVSWLQFFILAGCLGYVAMELRHLANEVKIAKEYSRNYTIARPDQRVSTLYQTGVRWQAGNDQTNVWIVIDATNEPQWFQGENSSKVKMKILPPVVVPGIKTE